MNKLAAAVDQLSSNYAPEMIAGSLTMYKRASASVALNEVYPSIADEIVQTFFKKACIGDDNQSINYAIDFSVGLMKVAGVPIHEDTPLKLASTAIMNKTAACHENDVACYHIICSMVKEAGIKDLATSTVKKLTKAETAKLYPKGRPGYITKSNGFNTHYELPKKETKSIIKSNRERPTGVDTSGKKGYEYHNTPNKGSHYQNQKDI